MMFAYVAYGVGGAAPATPPRSFESKMMKGACAC